VNAMKKSLKQAVREKFEAHELNADQLAKLGVLVENPTIPRSIRQTGRNWSARFAAVAAALIVSIGGFLGAHLYQKHSANVLLEAIAVEVADNHLKLKPLEIESQNLAVVLAYFDRLEFQTLESPRITENAGDQLLGGRYCSIQGIDAAQLRVVSPNGRLSTWYQAILPAEKLKFIPDIGDGDEPVVIAVKGLRVRIWQEQGVVFTEAR